MNDPGQLPLRDIHLPPPVSWWPPAPGWWVLSGLILLLILGAVYACRRYRDRRYAAARVARMEFQQSCEAYRQHRDALRLLRELSILLRRLSISTSPRSETAGLTGEQWLQYLDSRLPGQPFSAGPGRILAEAPYRQSVPVDQVEPVIRLCRQWIDAVDHGRETGT